MKHKTAILVLALILTSMEAFTQNTPLLLQVKGVTMDTSKTYLTYDGDPQKDLIGVLQLFGAASMQGADDDHETNPISGEVGFRFVKRNLNELSVSFQLHNNETISPRMGGFGSAVLVPGNGANSINFQHVRYTDLQRVLKNSPVKVGWGMGAQVTNTTWRLDDNVRQEGTIVHPRLFIIHRHQLTLDGPNRNTIAYSIAAGYAGRFIGGDIADNEAFLRNAIGTSKAYFHGFEVNFRLGFKNVYLKSDVSMIAKRSGTKVDGLTGVQASVGVVVSADILSFKVVGD